jgi:uncharacterized membrane protein (UPF0182 family)
MSISFTIFNAVTCCFVVVENKKNLFLQKKIMIQRIQTLWLLLAAVSLITAVFLPLATYQTADNTGTIIVTMSGYENATDIHKILPSMFIVLLINIFLAALIFITIFFYRKRSLQIRLNNISKLLNIALLVVFFIMINQIEKSGLVHSPTNYNIGAYLILAPFVFVVLANIAIRRDEKKVRAADRLR